MGSQGRLVTDFAEILTSAGLGPLSYKGFLDFWPHFLVLRPMGVSVVVGFNRVSLDFITQGVSMACSTPETVRVLGNCHSLP